MRPEGHWYDTPDTDNSPTPIIFDFLLYYFRIITFNTKIHYTILNVYTQNVPLNFNC